ncbi:MAG: hypothetical protein B6I38_04055 [Anaerolineaceae bacterium 4572_5.1]|nr:MAG: hypothetical protein B6I38_04055 [Anaerolineaceae bacterium 4572_5.1]
MTKSKGSIPPEVRAEVQKLIDEFNREHFSDKNLKEQGIVVGYSARFKGKYLYLDRDEYGTPSPICRLTWNGKMDNWDFAIYKYSSNRYAPDEWFFPGMGSVDGTVSGAMEAGLEAYQM